MSTDTYNKALHLLDIAVKQNNVEAIRKLMPVVEAYKPEPTETPPVGSRALRGMENAWEGFRQANTQMAESLGVVPEGATRSYTDEQMAEREAFEKHTTPSTVGDVTEMAAEIAPYALTTKRAPSMGLGALEGAAQFQEDPDYKDRAIGSVLGATLGGVGHTADEAIQGVRVDPGKMSTQAKRGVIESRNRGERLRPIDITTDQRVRGMQNKAYQSRWGQDVTKLAQDAEKQAREFASRYERTGDPSVLKGYQNKLKELRELESKMYDEAYEFVGDAPLDMGVLTRDLDDIMAKYEREGGDWRKQRAQFEHLMTEGLPDGNTVRDLRKFRTNLRTQKKLFQTKNRDSRPFEDAYLAVTRRINEAAERVDPYGAQLLDDANTFTLKKVVPVDELFDTRKLGETKLVNKFKRASPEEAVDMVKALDGDGQTDLMLRLHQDATTGAIDQGMKTGFSPAKYAKELEKNMHLFDAMGDKESTQGLIDFLRTAQDLTRDAANLPTGRSMSNISAWQTAMSFNPIPALMSRSSEFRGLAAKLAREAGGNKVPFKRSKEEIVSRMMTLIIQSTRAGTVKEGADWLNQSGYEPPSLDSVMTPHESERAY